MIISRRDPSLRHGKRAMDLGGANLRGPSAKIDQKPVLDNLWTDTDWSITLAKRVTRQLIGDLDPRQLFVDTDMLVGFDFAEVIEGACIKR